MPEKHKWTTDVLGPYVWTCLKCKLSVRHRRYPLGGMEWSNDGGKTWTHEAKSHPQPKCGGVVQESK